MATSRPGSSQNGQICLNLRGMGLSRRYGARSLLLVESIDQFVMPLPQADNRNAPATGAMAVLSRESGGGTARSAPQSLRGTFLNPVFPPTTTCFSPQPEYEEAGRTKD